MVGGIGLGVKVHPMNPGGCRSGTCWNGMAWPGRRLPRYRSLVPRTKREHHDHRGGAISQEPGQGAPSPGVHQPPPLVLHQ